jgi:hypothetical protein
MSRVCIAFDERGEVTEHELAPSDEEANRGWRGLMLAKDLETCRALLAGETVPLDRLRREWVARFGRRSVVAELVGLDEFNTIPDLSDNPDPSKRVTLDDFGPELPDRPDHPKGGGQDDRPRL